MLTRGDYDAEPIVFVHGNTASAVFWEDVMLALPDDYRSIAPDLRCFGLTEPTPIDATRGVREWSDDLYEITWSLGMREFHLVGWSLRRHCDAIRADHPNTVTTLTLSRLFRPTGFRERADRTAFHVGRLCWFSAGGADQEF